MEQASWKIFSMLKYESIDVRILLSMFSEFLSRKFIYFHTQSCQSFCCCCYCRRRRHRKCWTILDYYCFFLFADQIEILFNYICHSFYNCFCVSLSLLFSFLTLNTFYLVTKCDWMETEALSIHGDTLRSCILWKNGFAWRRGMACNEYKFQLVAILINAHTWFYIA